MRIRFDEQLKQLNKEMINMGTMIEESIGDAVKALMKQDVELAQKVEIFEIFQQLLRW